MTAQNEDKTLVFSFDGTGNEPSDAGEYEENESISNILKLHVLMGGGISSYQTETKTLANKKQLIFYYNGIGTRKDGEEIFLFGKLYSRIKSGINMAIAPSFGDARRILDDARQDFDKCYEAGDKLAIFGFSRGAALARKFADMILKDRKNCTVSFLGVFDTVTAMDGAHIWGKKIVSDVEFENWTLNDRIDKAVHLLSIDENRETFKPTLINKDPKNPKRILEVWFPGVHSDVGGGYWFDGLSDVCLEFMIKCCRDTLGDDILIADGKADSVRALLNARPETLAGLEVDDIAIHPLVKSAVHTNTGITTIMGNKPREICVSDNGQSSKNDIPILHYSVKKRFDEVADYRPAALHGLNFNLLIRARGDGKLELTEIHGISDLREF